MKNIVFLLMRISMIPSIIRATVQRRRVTILCYHDPSPETARAHFIALKSRYNIIPLKDYISARIDGSLDGLPPKPLVITLDDGHAGNYRLRQVLDEMSIPVTIFLTSGIVGTSRHFWFKHNSGSFIPENLKHMPDDQRLQTMKTYGYTDDVEYGDRQALSCDEIDEMKQLVDFQSHTATHPILPKCSDDKARREIVGSKADLESRLGLDIYIIAYPNGDYSDRDIELAKDAGYDCGLTVDLGFNDASTDLFRLRRIGVNDSASVNQMLATACGFWPYLRKCIKGISYGYAESLR